MRATDSRSIGKRILVRDQSHFDVPKGFDPFCPWLRQKALRYIYIPAASFLALCKMASNLDEDSYEFAA
jgi:hypothetical protein